MGRVKSEFLSALGVLFQIFKALVDDILAAGGDDENIRRIQADSELRKKIVKLVVQKPEDVKRDFVKSQMRSWSIFYQKFFRCIGGPFDYMDESIQELCAAKPEGMDRLIVVIAGITLADVAKVYNPQCQSDDCPTIRSSAAARNPYPHMYARWVNDSRVEKSLDCGVGQAELDKALRGQTEQGNWLLENALYELKRWDEIGSCLCEGFKNSDVDYFNDARSGIIKLMPQPRSNGDDITAE